MQRRPYRQDDFFPIKVIGKGSTGKVMLVQEKCSGVYYALKSIRKEELPTERQKQLARQERILLTEKILKLDSPFLTKLYASFQSPTHLFFLLEYHPGGDFATLLGQRFTLSEKITRFYAAEIVLGLEALHKAGIVYRDLKPENVLLGRDGHLVLVDFGLSKCLVDCNSDCTKTFCGTAEYLAPEVLIGSPYGKSVDLWSLGTMIFEMLTGTPPYWSDINREMYQKIVNNGPICFPSHLSAVAVDIVCKLLKNDPKRRLGYDDISALKAHPFFNDIDWELIASKRIQPPYSLALESDEDVRAFDPKFTSMASQFTPAADPEFATSNYFQGFTFSGN